jgi:hypothetical protein
METVNSSERTHYWEELLKDKFQEHKVEEFNALGKGKRNRKLVCDDDICAIFLCHFARNNYCFLLSFMSLW